MATHILIDDDIIEGEDSISLQDMARKAMIVFKYLKADISLGKVSELLGCDIEEAKQYLHGLGITTDRYLGDQLESLMDENARRVAKDLGVDL